MEALLTRKKGFLSILTSLEASSNWNDGFSFASSLQFPLIAAPMMMNYSNFGRGLMFKLRINETVPLNFPEEILEELEA